MIEYVELPEFKKDFNRLKKRFRTLPDDFEIAKKAAIDLFHIRGINNLSTFEMPYYSGVLSVYKLKKFACHYLKGRGVRSGIRVIYSWNEDRKVATFIEMYFKGDKVNEDRVRIKQYLKSLVA